MKNKTTYLFTLALIATLFALSSCKKEATPYNNPFFHIMVDNKSSVEVLANRKDTVGYNVYLSAELQFDPIDVEYKVTVGNGLLEGRDFELITKGTKLTFPQGIFQRPIKIAWKEAVLDPTKNNTIVIELISNTKNYTLGLPGPDGLQRKFTITKR